MSSKNSSVLQIVCLQILACAFVLLASSPISAQERISNFDVRAEGAGVFSPDVINGNYAIVKTGTEINFTISAQTISNWMGLTAGFMISSPDNSITTITHTAGPSFTPDWNSQNLDGTNGPVVTLNSWDGSLPDSMLGGWAVFFGDGWGSEQLAEVIYFSMIIDEGQSGTVCIDSGFFPPAGEWLAYPDGSPQWGASVGGYPIGGYCITVVDEYLDVCDTPGDANHDGKVNVADAIGVIQRIFRGAPHPYSCREMDFNGDGAISIADAVDFFLYAHRLGGPPICGPVGMACGE
ncbi:dockerin type I repeat-containing protein [Gemmatimonas aurantiaca]|nr:dockerin type I repeat-containing protein [Gemmatimonas aurantiaca]